MSWKNLSIEDVAEFQCVKDWLAEVATRRTGSKGTRTNYLVRLRDYCNWRKLTPAELLKEDVPYREGKKKTVAEQSVTKYFQHLITEYINKHTGKKGLDRETAKSIYGVLRSFFTRNEVLFYEKTPAGKGKAKASVSLPPDKLRAVVDAGNLRTKYAVCGLASTGMRPGDFVQLVYGDTKQDYEAGELRLYIEKESEKEDLLFGVFLSRQATRYLRMMLEERKKNGETFNDKTPLLAHVQEGESGPISTDQLARIVKEAGERVGMYLTPKLFRKNFRTSASPVIGRDATCKMAAWTIPGVGGKYFLPPREKCLESYRRIEEFFTYEEAKTAEEQALDSVINFAIARGLPMDKIEEIRRVARQQKLKADEVAKMIRPLVKQAQEAGGMPYQTIIAKEMEDLFVRVLKGVKKRMEE